MEYSVPELKPPIRVLMGPGPANIHPRVLKAMNTRLLGHLDPAFLQIMDEVREGLRHVFQTNNRFTLPVPGTGTAAMEASLCNLIEPGDHVLTCVNGYFGERLFEIANRYEGTVERVDAEWGTPINPDDVRTALQNHTYKVVTLVHAETSTGVLNPAEEISQLAHDHGAMIILDTVTSLGGLPVETDVWNIDACFSAAQKCIGAPPGSSPLTFNDRAMNVVMNRRNKVSSLYFDLSLLEKYWGSERAYHHTAPITNIFALHEAIRRLLEEGLDTSFARHSLQHKALTAGLQAIDLDLVVDTPYQLPMLTTVYIPEGMNDKDIRDKLYNEYNIEVGGGLGKFAGRVIRIGLMGYSCNKRHVLFFLAALESILVSNGYDLEHGASLRAANEVYNVENIHNSHLVGV